MRYLYLKSKSFLLPTFIVVLYILVMVALLQVGDTKYYQLNRTLIQWDGQHYLSVARDGYKKFPCGYNSDYICGNVGWFPLLPLLSRMMAITGIGYNWAIILTSWLLFWAGILIFYGLISKRFGERAALYSLLAMLIFPGSFYFLTAFPNSLFFLLAVIFFLYLDKEKYRWLWLSTGLLTLTHPSASIIALPVLYLIIRNWKRHDTKTRQWLILSLVSMASAFFVYFGYYWLKFDDFFLYFHFQSQSYYAHQPTFPLIPIVNQFMHPSANWPVLVMLAYIVVITIVYFNKKIPVSWQIFMFALLLFTPTMGTTDCYYRHIEAAFPLYVMIGLKTDTHPGKYLFWFYVIISIILMWFVFLESYKAGKLM